MFISIFRNFFYDVIVKVDIFRIFEFLCCIVWFLNNEDNILVCLRYSWVLICFDDVMFVFDYLYNGMFCMVG